MPLVQELTPHQVMADVGTCIRQLLALDCTSIFTVGFCFGGSYSWVSAAFHDELDGAVGFYGRPARALRLADVEYELVEFEGAPHSFFDRKQEEFQEASDDAWRRTLEFIEKRSR